MKIKEIYESTTAGAIASVAMPIGGVQKRAGSLFKGKKTKNKFFEGRVKELMMDLKELTDEEFKNKYGKTKAEVRKSMSQPVKEEEVNETDLILVPGQGKKLKPGFISKDNDRRDHEVDMARSDLIACYKNAKAIFHMIKNRSEDEGIEGWVQEKLIKASDYLNTVKEHLDSKVQQENIPHGGVIAGGQVQEEKKGLWANIHAKRERIKKGSGEKMRKPGSKGAPSAQDFKNSQ